MTDTPLSIKEEEEEKEAKPKLTRRKKEKSGRAIDIMSNRRGHVTSITQNGRNKTPPKKIKRKYAHHTQQHCARYIYIYRNTDERIRVETGSTRKVAHTQRPTRKTAARPHRYSSGVEDEVNGQRNGTRQLTSSERDGFICRSPLT
jgi:hypothetical protein